MTSVTKFVMMVTMDTNARKHVSANFLIWMQHVTIGMDSVTVTLDIPIYTVIKPVPKEHMDSSVKVDASVKTIPPAILHLDIVRV